MRIHMICIEKCKAIASCTNVWTQRKRANLFGESAQAGDQQDRPVVYHRL
jgi:hypothetical protein